MRIKSFLIRLLVAWGAASLLMLVLGVAVLYFAGQWLKAADTPAKVDAMIVLAGSPQRAMYASDLYRQGYAPTVYVSRPAREREHSTLEQFGIVLPTEEFVNRRILNHGGVSDQKIQVYSLGSVNTLDEARTLRDALPRTTHAIMIVTSPYHVRRVKMVFGEVFHGSGISVRVVASPHEPFPDHWWTNRDAAQQTILEVIKIVFYQAGGSFPRGSQ